MTAKSDTTIHLPKQLDDPAFAEFRKTILSSEKLSVAEYFEGMPEKERQKHAKYCYDYCKVAEKAYLDTPGETTYRLNELGGITGVTYSSGEKKSKAGDIWWKSKSAVVATGSWSTVKSLDQSYDFEEIETILRSRRPEWTLDFLAKIIAGIDLHYGMETYWEMYRRFYCEGILKPLRRDSITELMFAVLSGSRFTESWKREKGEKVSSVIDSLKDDPDLVEHEFWHIFGIETFRRNWCYTTHDAFGLWKDAICTLVLDGTIPLDRVLDGCFGALSRGFTEHQSKWFVQLLDRLIEKLAILDGELVADKRFLALLEHEHSSPRGLGLKIFERLLKSGALKPDGMAGRLASTLRETAKTKPKKALTLLDKMAGQRPNLHNEIFSALLVALEHEAVEIQDAGVNLLSKYGAFDDPKILAVVLGRSASLASFVRKKIPGSTKSSSASIGVLDLCSDKDESIPLREILTPIQNFDELLDAATRLIESANDPDEIERFLDGMSRIGTEKPKDFDKMTAPLLKRMLRLLGTQQNIDTSDNTAKRLEIFPPFTGENIATDCLYLVLAWVIGELPRIKIIGDINSYGLGSTLSELTILGKRWIHSAYVGHKDGCPAYRIFSEHVKSLSEQIVQGISRRRLSTPTHRGGWIDPVVFVQRLIDSHEAKIVHDDFDRVLALLRLDFQGREESLKMLDVKIKKRDEYIQAVRYALGASKCKVGKTAHYWIAAGRCRAPFDDIDALEMKFPGLGPDAGEAAVYSLEKAKSFRIGVRCEPASRKKTDAALFPTVALHASNTYHYMDARQENPWKLTVWPSNPDPAIGAAIQSHFEYRDGNYDTGFIPYIEVLRKMDVSIRKVGAAAIFVGLGMKYVAIPVAATDTLIMAVSQDRLKAAQVQEAIHELLKTGLLVPTRWLKPLQTVAEQSPKHTIFVQDVLEGMIPRLETKTTSAFLELLYEIVSSQGRAIRDEECIRYLKSFKGSGKAAKLTKKLLDL